MEDENKIDIIGIYEVDGDKITIKDYDKKRDVFEIKYKNKETNSIETKQLYADTLEFSDVLELYEEKLTKMLKNVNEKIKPYFKSIETTKFMLLVPLFFVAYVSGLFTLYVPVEKIISIFWKSAILSFFVGIPIAETKFYYSPFWVKKYVKNEDLVKSFTKIYNQLTRIKSIHSYYQNVFIALYKKKIKEEKKARKPKSRREIKKEMEEAYKKEKELHELYLKNNPRPAPFPQYTTAEMIEYMYPKSLDDAIYIERNVISENAKKRIKDFQTYKSLPELTRRHYYRMARQHGMHLTSDLLSKKIEDLACLRDESNFEMFSIAEYYNQSLRIDGESKIIPNYIHTKYGNYILDSSGNVIKVEVSKSAESYFLDEQRSRREKKQNARFKIASEKKLIEQQIQRRIKEFHLYIDLSEPERIRYYRLAKENRFNSDNILRSYDLNDLCDDNLKKTFQRFAVGEFKTHSIHASGNTQELNKIKPSEIVTDYGTYHIDSSGKVVRIDNEYGVECKDNEKRR